jgi:hypothetical protein
MLRLRPAGVACPELVEGLSTNGKRTTASRAVRPERSAAKPKGNQSMCDPYFKKDSYTELGYLLLQVMFIELPSFCISTFLTLPV